jgi:hypothetical protein
MALSLSSAPAGGEAPGLTVSCMEATWMPSLSAVSHSSTSVSLSLHTSREGYHMSSHKV